MSGDGYRDNAAAAARVLAAVWCRSVGTSWTLELRKLRRGTALGPVVDWINSGVPISQPAPTRCSPNAGCTCFASSSPALRRTIGIASATCAETLN